MKTLDASLAARNFRNLLDSTMLGESTLITRFGKPVAVIGPVEAQMDKPIAVAPTERPVARPLEVRNVTGLTADTVTGTSFTYAGPRSQAELDEARGISLEQQKAAQKKRDALLRGSRKEKA